MVIVSTPSLSMKVIDAISLVYFVLKYNITALKSIHIMAVDITKTCNIELSRVQGMTLETNHLFRNRRDKANYRCNFGIKEVQS